MRINSLLLLFVRYPIDLKGRDTTTQYYPGTKYEKQHSVKMKLAYQLYIYILGNWCFREFLE